MTRFTRARTLAGGLSLALCFALTPACAVLRGIQDSMLFYPDQPDDGTPEEAGLNAKDLRPLTSDGLKLHAWFFPAPHPVGSLLFSHGNASNVTGWRYIVRPLLELGLNVMLFDYRGYGTSEGTPSEEGLYRDGDAALAELLEQPEARALPVYYYGQSLGGAVMADLAVRQPPTALILQSTFTTLPDMANHLYRLIPRSWVPGRFDTLHKVAAIRCPVLIIHGLRDNFVPVGMARRLYAAAPAARRRMVLLPGISHEDVWSRDTPKVVSALKELIGETASRPQTASSVGPDSPAAVGAGGAVYGRAAPARN